MGTIRFENVSKEFPGMGRPAVNGCSLEVAEGNFVVILGPSGCGKTTLMKMVNRLYDPTSGTIYLDERDVQQINATDLRRQIGYVIQQIGLFPHMTVAQNVSVVPRLLKWEQARTDRRVDELLDLVDLPPAEYRDRYPAQLSGGQQQRVGVARALAGDPDVILMDEPFGAVDAITRESLQDEMLALQHQLHKTILFVTHDVDEALRLADQIVIMQSGQIVQYATPLEILTTPANDFVNQLVGGDDMVRQLSLVRVEAAMQPLPSSFRRNGEPTIEGERSLRTALSHLLRVDTEQLVVTENGTQTGLLSLADIRAHAERGENGESAP
ncbi:MAG: ABC transporter ATP-binding protein [Caldilineaceae bacterium]